MYYAGVGTCSQQHKETSVVRENSDLPALLDVVEHFAHVRQEARVTGVAGFLLAILLVFDGHTKCHQQIGLIDVHGAYLGVLTRVPQGSWRWCQL